MVLRKQIIQYFLIALLAKALLFVFFHFAYAENYKGDKVIAHISFLTKDVVDYYLPTENLINKGTYGRFGAGYGWHWATRMPGWLPIYGPLYYFLGTKWAHVFSILLQIIADALAVVLLSLTAKKLFNSNTAFYLTFLLYTSSAFVSTFNNTLRSDSLCASFTVFSLFFFVRALQKNDKKDWLLGGFFIGWATFMRPATGTLIAAYLLIYLLHNPGIKTLSIKKITRTIFLFTAPFLFFLSLWTYRNYKALDRFIPSTTTNEEFFFDDPQRKALWDVIAAWGGPLNSWGDESYYVWFLVPETKEQARKLQSYAPFEKGIFTPDYNLDSLKQLRTYYWLSRNTELDPAKRNYYKNLSVQKSYAYLTSYKKYNKFYYIFGANLHLISNYLFIKQTFALPFEKQTLHDKLIRAFYFFHYYIILIFFFLGAGFVIFKKNKTGILLLLLPIANIITHAVAIGWIYNWYLAPVYPIFALYAGYSLSEILKRFSPPDSSLQK